MRSLLYIVFAFVFLACVRVPNHVVDPDDMAELLADMYTAECIADHNHMEFRADSSRLALRQSVLDKHGVTQADFDSSLMWYGKNFDKYMKVNENVVKILQKRDAELGNAIVQGSASFSGDSVDVWAASKFVLINKRFPSNFVSFEISNDENWQQGDVYTWRIKLPDGDARSVRWYMLGEYGDSTLEYLSSSTSTMGWNEVTFVSDSAKMLQSLKGYFEPLADRDETKANRDLWIDSISLIRKRVNPDLVLQRHRLRTLKEI